MPGILKKNQNGCLAKNEKEFHIARLKREISGLKKLRKISDFQNIYRNGKSYANRLLVMYVMRNGKKTMKNQKYRSAKSRQQCGTPLKHWKSTVCLILPD